MDGTAAQGPASLQGIRVIDASRVLGGPFATQVLADHGAEVVKIEPPQGDETRGWGPPFLDEGVSWYFAGANRNKTALTLDLKSASGRERLLDLLSGADVFVENFRPGALSGWGLGYDEVLKQRFPHLVLCSITGFGADGPLGGLPGYDAIAQALSGLMSVNGHEETGPTRIGMPAVDMVTGLYAANGILMALQERQRSGLGQRVETTLFDSALSLMHPHLPNYFATSDPPRRTGNDHPNITPYSTYEAADGPVYLAVGNDGQFTKLCAHLGAPELAQDPRFATNAARCGHRPELREALEEHLAGIPCEELSQGLLAEGVPCGPILDAGQAAEHPHTAHRGMIVELEGGYRGVASPIKMSRTPAVYHTPPPRIPRPEKDPDSW